MRVFLFIILSVFVFFVSCKRNDVLRQELVLLQSCPIEMHLDEMECFSRRTNEDSTIREEYYRTPMLLLVYSDSTSCSPCFVKNMFLWEQFIDSLNSRYAGLVNICIVFAPSKQSYRDLKISLQNSGYGHAVFIDTTNCFLTQNKYIPNNKRMHTFLLDEHRNVVLAGSPLDNPRIEDMFFDILDNRLE